MTQTETFGKPISESKSALSSLVHGAHTDWPWWGTANSRSRDNANHFPVRRYFIMARSSRCVHHPTLPSCFHAVKYANSSVASTQFLVLLSARIRERMLAFCLPEQFKKHAETLHGIVRLIIVRVASLRRPLGIFSSTAFVSAIEVVSASRRTVYLTGRSRVFIPFYVPCNHVRRNDHC